MKVMFMFYEIWQPCNQRLFEIAPIGFGILKLLQDTKIMFEVNQVTKYGRRKNIYLKL